MQSGLSHVAIPRTKNQSFQIKLQSRRHEMLTFEKAMAVNVAMAVPMPVAVAVPVAVALAEAWLSAVM